MYGHHNDLNMITKGEQSKDENPPAAYIYILLYACCQNTSMYLYNLIDLK